jgi:hypothetical protein
MHPGFHARADAIKTAQVVPPKIDVFYVETGGLPEKREDWSKQAQQNIMTAVQRELQGKSPFVIKSPSDDALLEGTDPNLEETYALFDVVNKSILLHTYHPAPEYRFEEKIKNFDYSLGHEVKDLTNLKAHALLLISGADHIWSEGRKALQALGVILGIGAGVATGVVIIPRLGGGTGISAALIDVRDGSILWYNSIASGAGYDLRDPASAASLVKDLFKDFPPSEGK